MSLYHYLNRIRRLDTLIRQKSTGTPRELASRLEISERWLFVLLDELRNELNCPIEYDRKRRSYYYAENGRVYLEFRNEMQKEQMRKVSGGIVLINLLHCYYNCSAINENDNRKYTFFHRCRFT